MDASCRPTSVDGRRLLLLLVIGVALGAASMVLHPRAAAWRQELPEHALTLATVRQHQAQGGVLWVDARSTADYEQDHIPGAVLCNEDDWDAGLMRVLEAWQPGDLVVVYCDAERCDASDAVGERLRRETGFEDIHTLHGGWQTWRADR